MTQDFDQRPAADAARLKSAWRKALAALALLFAWTVFLYRETAVAMVTIWWRSETFTHGFLVLPIVLWLVWRQRKAIAELTPTPNAVVFLLVAGAAFAWLLGDLVAVNSVTQLAFVTLLVLSVPTVLGLQVTRLIIFPLCFLFFSVPVGEFLLPLFMDWTANFTVIALRLTGIPVYREGLQFVIPSGNWSVVEACSGIRYLIASLTVGTLFAYLNYQSAVRRVLFVIVSIIVPVVANWLRAYIIVLLGHFSGNTLAVGVDHLIYGWIFFGFVIMLMFIIGARWAEPDAVTHARIPGVVGANVAKNSRLMWISAACFAAMIAWPHAAIWTIDQRESGGSVSLSAPAALTPDWALGSASVPEFKPVFKNPSAEVIATYSKQGRNVGLYLGYYQHQTYVRKLVSSDNVLVETRSTNWAEVGRGTYRLKLSGNPVEVRASEVRGLPQPGQAGDGRLTVWQIYWINGTLTSSDYLAKVYSAVQRLTGRGDNSAAIVVYTSKEQAGGGDAVLESFLAANYDAINALLLKARQDQ